jgi:hypothetical protein
MNSLKLTVLTVHYRVTILLVLKMEHNVPVETAMECTVHPMTAQCCVVSLTLIVCVEVQVQISYTTQALVSNTLYQLSHFKGLYCNSALGYFWLGPKCP